VIPDVVLFAAEEEVWFSTGNLSRFPGGEPHSARLQLAVAAQIINEPSPEASLLLWVLKPAFQIALGEFACHGCKLLIFTPTLSLEVLHSGTVEAASARKKVTSKVTPSSEQHLAPECAEIPGLPSASISRGKTILLSLVLRVWIGI